MLIHELTPAECYDVLGRAAYGRLGCARYDQPYVVPFVFKLDQAGSCLYSISTVGQKIHWMRENPKVCVEVDEVGDQFHWTTFSRLGATKKSATCSTTKTCDGKRTSYSAIALRGGCRRWARWPPAKNTIHR